MKHRWLILRFWAARRRHRQDELTQDLEFDGLR
jgi:hypothetical protein